MDSAARFCNAVTKKLGTLLYFCWYIFITRPLRCLATGWLREIGLTSIHMHCVFVCAVCAIYIYIYIYTYTHMHIDTNIELQMLHNYAFEAFDFTSYVMSQDVSTVNPNAHKGSPSPFCAEACLQKSSGS